MDGQRAFVTSDHHFWSVKHPLLHEWTEAEDEAHVAAWNEVVGKDDLVYYVGDFCDGTVADMMALRQRLNGHIILIKGNHETQDDAVYQAVFDAVYEELVLDDLKVMFVHNPAGVELPSDMKLIYGHIHRNQDVAPPVTSNSFCACGKWHAWRPVPILQALARMEDCKK